MPTSYRDLLVWKKSMQLVERVYALVRLLPPEERNVLSDQMRRAAISIPSNIAEGHGRFSSKEFAHFLSVARGSLYELSTQLLICEQVGYLSAEQIESALSLEREIEKMLSALARKLKENNPTSSSPD